MDTSGGREGECIAFLGQLLGQAGVQPTYLALEAGRPNLVAHVAGRGQAAPLLLYGHVDVVPAAEASWSRPPFSAELGDGVVWGRGALDMKGGVAMLLTAFLETAAGTLHLETSSWRSPSTKRAAAVRGWGSSNGVPSSSRESVTPSVSQAGSRSGTEAGGSC